MAGSSLIGNLAVLLSMDTSAFERGATHAQRLMARTQRQFQQIGQRISSIGAGMSIGITAPFTALIATAIPAAIESRQAMGQVEAALNSMGAAAGRNAAQLQQAASTLQDISLFDDDDILRKVTSNLLTFGNVSGEVFDRAQLSIVNLSARLGTDLQSATLMVGKALNEPIQGLAALRRTGIQFTADQQAMIRTMVAAGDTAGAQAVMLGELERQFGGAAAAARAAQPDAAMQQSWRNFQEVIGEIALRFLPPLTNLLARVLDSFNNLSPRMQQVAVGTAAFAAAIGPVLLVVGPLVGAIGSLLPHLVRIIPALSGAGAAAGASAAGFAGLLRVLGPVALAAAAIYTVFQNWDQITGFIGRVNERITGTQQRLAEMNREAQAAGGTFSQFASYEAFKAHFWQRLEVSIGAIGRRFADLQSDLNAVQAWADRTDAAMVRFAANMVISIRDFATQSAAAIRHLVTEVGNWIGGRLNAIWESARAKIEQVKGWFRDLYVAVVGNSYVPDMVDEIGEHMRRLQQEMVVPAQDAAEASAQAFSNLRHVIAELFPEEAAVAEWQEKLRQLREAFEAGRISANLFEEASSRATQEHLDRRGESGSTITPLDLGDQSDNIRRDLDALASAWTDRFSRMSEATRELGSNINDIVTHGLKGMMRGFTSLKDIALNVLYAIGDAIIDNLMKGGNGASGGGGIGGAIASIITAALPAFGGGKAMGGPVVPGKYYRVGERGPEWFAPTTAGRIIPNNDNGGPPVNVNINLTYNGNLATQEDVVRVGMMIKPAAIQAITEARRRGSM